jgi:hypothetical protein
MRASIDNYCREHWTQTSFDAWLEKQGTICEQSATEKKHLTMQIMKK